MRLSRRRPDRRLRLLALLAPIVLVASSCDGLLGDLTDSMTGGPDPEGVDEPAAVIEPAADADGNESGDEDGDAPPAEPADPGTPPAAGDPAMPDDPAEHTMLGMPGPKLDSSELPAGHPGFSDVRVRSAGSASYDQVLPGQVNPATGLASGNFRVPCKFSHMSYDDPIVHPGQPGAAHLHTFFGNTEADASSTAESLAATGSSTCSGGIIDRSAYWIPTLLDAAGKPVVPSELPNFNMFYYKSGWHGVAAAETEPFPPGLQMIAGDASATSPQDLDIIAWACTDDDGYHPSPTMPDCQEGQEMYLQVFFPDCWDGVDTAWDGGAHVAYSTSSGCPDGWVGIPQLTTNVYWDVAGAASGGYRLSSDPEGVAPGLTAHADFFDGWDPAFVETFVERCINDGKDCQSNLLGDGTRLYWD